MIDDLQKIGFVLVLSFADNRNKNSSGSNSINNNDNNKSSNCSSKSNTNNTSSNSNNKSNSSNGTNSSSGFNSANYRGPMLPKFIRDPLYPGKMQNLLIKWKPVPSILLQPVKLLLLGQVADFRQRRHVPVHGEDAVSGHHDCSSSGAFLQLGLQVYGQKKVTSVRTRAWFNFPLGLAKVSYFVIFSTQLIGVKDLLYRKGPIVLILFDVVKGLFYDISSTDRFLIFTQKIV